MSFESNKQLAAKAALDYIKVGDVIGVGTGSTVKHFINALAQYKIRIEGAVASSQATSVQLAECNIHEFNLNETGDLPVYVDGADEANRRLQLIKGGGGALTREKIVAAASHQFVCIVDETKVVDVLGAYALPVEVIPMAQSFAARQLTALGGIPRLRTTDADERFITDNANVILDVGGLEMTDPPALETQLNQIPGVVCTGLFAARPADVLLVGGNTKVTTLTR